jgi:hypothetical protein
MNLMDTIRRLWRVRHLPDGERAAALDPDIRELRQRQHEDLSTLQSLAARKWLREHGYERRREADG